MACAFQELNLFVWKLLSSTLMSHLVGRRVQGGRGFEHKQRVSHRTYVFRRQYYSTSGSFSYLEVI